MIPYNPSSFNSNKTILEQILEIKKWLIAHPSYKVYYCTSNFMPTGDDDRAFSEIAGTEEEVQNIAVGDLLVFPDAYYSEVIAVDLDNELVTVALPATNFKGPQGATGPSGADGQNGTNGTNGTCIRKYNGNSNANPSTLYAISNLNFSTSLQQYDLIYFNDGYAGFVSNVNIGLSSFQISTRFYVNGTNGTDGAYVSNASVDANGDLIITIYNPATSTTIQVNAGYVVGPAGPSNPEGTDVLSTGETSGKVLTADGNGNASWQTPSGSSIEIIDITGRTAPLSSSEMNKIINQTAILVNNNRYYTSYWVSSTAINLMSFYSQGTTLSIYRGIITLSTGVFTMYTVDSMRYNPRASNIDSQTATNGQVLTADGNGGASWQNAGGGIEYVHFTGTNGTFSASDMTKINNGAFLYSDTNDNIYRCVQKASTLITYMQVAYYNSTGRSLMTSISINANTGVWNLYTMIKYVKGENINSETATNGQVLTANGNGGVSWQNAGGSTLYQHNITLSSSPTSTSGYIVHFQIINTTSTQLSIGDIISYVNTNFDTDILIATGKYNATSTNSYIVIGVYQFGGSTLYARYVDRSDINYHNITISNGTLKDNVIAL